MLTEPSDNLVAEVEGQQKRSGALLIVCAPSGAGKSTLIGRLCAEFPRIGFSVSCTTRPRRPHEVAGRDYVFLDEQTFLFRRREGFFAETARVHGNWYGTPLRALTEMLAEGRDVLFDIDVQGAAQLRLSIPGGTYVFILPPSMAELERRLRGRGTDAEEAIARRLANARREIREANWFDAWIVNDDLDAAYDKLRAVYVQATLKPVLQPHFALSLLEDEA